MYDFNTEYTLYHSITPRDWARIEGFASRLPSGRRLHLTIPTTHKDTAGNVVMALAATLPEVPLDQNEIAPMIDEEAVMRTFPGFRDDAHLEDFTRNVAHMTDMAMRYDPKTHHVYLSLSYEHAQRLLDVQTSRQKEIAAENVDTLKNLPLPEKERNFTIDPLVHVLQNHSDYLGTREGRNNLVHIMVDFLRFTLQDRDLLPRPGQEEQAQGLGSKLMGRLVQMLSRPPEDPAREIAKKAGREINKANQKLILECGRQCHEALDRYDTLKQVSPEMALAAFAGDYEQIILDQIRKHLLHGRYSSGRDETDTGRW